jgi:hypothetical protein
MKTKIEVVERGRGLLHVKMVLCGESIGVVVRVIFL